MAATTRTITDTIYKLDGTPWEGATVRVDRVDRPMIDSDGTIGDSTVSGTTDENGDVSLAVAVPPSGAGRYRLTRPVESGKPVDVAYFYLAEGDPISVGEILAATASALPEDAVLTLLSAYLSKANNLSDLASAATARTNLGLGTAATAATGDFEAAGAVAAHTGASSAAHAASAISVTPAGELTSADVQAALEEIQGDIDGMGGGDVDDLTTTTGSSTNMLRVAAAGGLEYRTTAQVLSDIGAAPTASPTFTGTVTLPTTVASVIKPASDSTTALQLANAAGTAVVTVDTTNKQILIPDGGSAIPSIAFASDPDTGFYRYSANAYALALGGTPVAAFRNDETYTFLNLITSREGTSVNHDVLRISNDENNAASFILNKNKDAFEIESWIIGSTYNASILLNPRGGNVTIGQTNSPTARLDIAASTTTAASLRIRSGTAPTTPNAGDIWNDGSNFNFYGAGLNLHTGVIKPASDSTTALQLTNAAGTAVLTVDTTNLSVIVPKIYIGTLAQGNYFQTISDNDMVIGGTHLHTQFGYWLGDGTSRQIGIVNNSYEMGFYVSGVLRVLFDNIGRIGTGGNTDPTAYADLAAATTTAASLRIRSGTAPTTPNDGDLYYDGSNLLIYVSSAWYTLDKTAV